MCEDYQVGPMNSAMEHKKGVYFSLNWMETLILMPWKVDAESKQKNTTFLTISLLNSPSNTFIEFLIMFIKLFVVQFFFICSKFSKIFVFLKISTK